MIFEQLCDVLSEQFSVDRESITAETHFVDDLCADSLDVMELTMVLEEEFELSDEEKEELLQLRTVGEVVDYINAHLEQ